MPIARNSPRNLLTSLVLVFPLFLIYQLGVLFTLPVLNGADFLTIILFRQVGLSTSGYLIFTAAVTAAFFVGVALLRRRQRFDSGVVMPMLLESIIYALTMGSLIYFVMTRLMGMNGLLSAGFIDGQGIFTRLIMSIGAGVYEETVFRLALIPALVGLFSSVMGTRRNTAVILAFVLSSLAFSAVHHLGAYGDPLHLGIFVFRFLAGIFFALLFWFRGFAVAVYTHAFYDIYVLLLR